jgi:RNA polymerase sigma factor (TIGR02999 family)
LFRYTQGFRELLTENGDITLLLRQWGGGDTTALENLFSLVYPQLKQIARSLFRGEKPESILQPTVLVNELYLKLLRNHSLKLEDRAHFYSFAARLMRRVLLDQARMENRLKRDGGFSVPLTDNLAFIDGSSPEIIDLDRVLTELDQIDSRKCRMLELRFFLGFTAEETAELLGVSKATVDRDLKFARSWLYDKLHPSD